jgi:hypothetical protein
MLLCMMPCMLLCMLSCMLSSLIHPIAQSFPALSCLGSRHSPTFSCLAPQLGYLHFYSLPGSSRFLFGSSLTCVCLCVSALQLSTGILLPWRFSVLGRFSAQLLRACQLWRSPCLALSRFSSQSAAPGLRPSSARLCLPALTLGYSGPRPSQFSPALVLGQSTALAPRYQHSALSLRLSTLVSTYA